MRYIYITLFFLCYIGKTNAQQEQSLYFMDGNFYNHYTNPAKLPEYKAMFNILPTPYFNFSNTGFSFNDLFEEQGDSLMLSPQKLLKSLRKYNFLQLNLNIDPISFAFRIKKFHFSFNYAMKTSIYLNYPRSFFDLAWEGNGQFLDETVDIAPDFQAMLYNEFAIGAGYQINDKWSVGGRLKILVGGFDASTDRASATLYTNPEIYQLELATDYRVNVSAFGIPENIREGSKDTTQSNSLDFSKFPRFMGPNVGAAVDLGGTFQLNDKWRFALSVTDLGAIRWNTNATNFYSNGQYDYDGLDVSALVKEENVEFDVIVDTLVERLQFNQTQNSYTTWLPVKMYMGAEYTPVKWFTAGAMVYNEVYKRQAFPAFSLSARFHAGRFFSGGLVYGIRNRRFDNLGANLMFDLGALHIFLVSDNIIPIFAPFDARNTNIRFGIHFNIGKLKKD
ncbi:MAG: hypothetical protein GY810_04670 [Aureispira sp.]|nr:hypothetical protein [Aureispira sp.]